MITTTIVWTVLPAGFNPKTGLYKASILVSPRLETDHVGDTVSSSAIANWPGIVRNLTMTLWANIETDHRSPCQFAEGYKDGLSDAKWTALLGSVPIESHVQSANAAKQIHSFGATAIAAMVRNVYSHVAANHPRARPAIQPSATDPLNKAVSEVRTAMAALPQIALTALPAISAGPTRAELTSAYAGATGLQGGAPFEVMRHALYYNRQNHRKHARAKRNGAPVTPPIDAPIPKPVLPTIDFHTVVGHLGDHPNVLRQLGLIIDVEFAMPPGVTSPAVLCIDPGPLPSSTPPILNITPKTQVTFGATRLATQPLAPDAFVDGQIALQNGKYAIEQIDVDAAATKFAEMAVQSATPSGTDGLPALRSNGFTVLRTGREDDLYTAFLNTQKWYEAWLPDAVLLRAEQTVRGYRVDVSVNGGTWRSLCERQANVAFGGYSILSPKEEGYVKATVATSPPDAPDEINHHEAVFGWEGWSLTVPRPGAPITPGHDGATLRQTEAAGDPSNPAAAGSPVSITIRPTKGGLPRLRFGHSYRFRARLVDLAGNDLSSGGEAGASLDQVYSRQEPVPGPTLVQRAPLTEGEHLEHLVIRSNPYGKIPISDPAAYAAQFTAVDIGNPLGPAQMQINGAQVKTMNAYSGTSERWVAPPKGSWALVETHGRFDGLFHDAISAALAATPSDEAGARTIATSFFNASTKEAGTFLDASVVVVDATQSPPTSAISPNPFLLWSGSAPLVGITIARGDAPPTGSYVVYPNALTAPPLLPYFADPNSAGLSLDFTSTLNAPLGVKHTPWAPRAGYAWPEYAVVPLQLAGGPLGSAVQYSPSVAGGPVTLTLPPGGRLDVQYSSFMSDPSVMAHDAAAQGGGAATKQAVADGAHWMMTPSRTLTFVHAVQQPKLPAFGVDFAVPDRATADTRAPLAGTIVVDGATTSTFELRGEWNDQVDVAPGPGVIDVDGIKWVKHVGRVKTWTVAPADKTLALTGSVHELGDTKRHDVTYTAIATTRFREYFPPSLTADSANITSSRRFSKTTIIKSSARPPQPRVLYAIPTFRSDPPTVSNATTTKIRQGRGLRIYVDRPWFVTGNDERLAVLVGSPASAPASLVSQWGIDPIWFPQKETIAPLDMTHFIGEPFSSLQNLVLAEGGGVVNAAAYAPKLNSDRNVWYFDVELATDAIDAPFVRLALARVQPYSIGELHLSQVVRLEMVKLASDRTAVVTQNPDKSVNVAVSGRVFANEKWTPPHAGAHGSGGGIGIVLGNPAIGSGHVVVAQIEESTLPAPGDLDWTPLGDATLLWATQPGVVYDNYSTQITFSGRVPLPANASTNAKHRLVVKELEVYATDVGVKDGSGHAVHIGSTDLLPSRSRVVYADIVPLSF